MENKLIHIEIVSPSKSVLDEKVQSVTIPGTSGQFQVLYNHAAILSSFQIGIIKIVDSTGKVKKYATSGGTVEVKNNHVVVLSETAEYSEDIDINRAEEAKKRAEQRLKDKENIDVKRAELSLAKALNRLKVAK